MKLFLIKIGKVLSVLSQDGLFKGLRRIFQALVSILFRRVKPGDVLIITGGAGVGDSALYRAHYVAEELNFQALKTSVTTQDSPFLNTYVSRFKIFIFHRVLFTKSVGNLIEKIKKQNKEIIFETDDLVFDPQYLKFMDFYKNMNALVKKLYEKGLGREILMDDYVRVCTTSTKFLSDKLSALGKKVFIVKNKLSKQDIDGIKKIKLTRQDGKIRIGYFSGTASHNKDFATISDVLIAILEKYPQVELILFGPLKLEEKFSKFQARIIQKTFVVREKHFENVASVDINIAPLEIDNPFCQAKSEVKFLEAGALGVPTVATATEPFCLAIEDGVDGFVASNSQEWQSKISRLIEESSFRQEMGLRARQKVMKEYITLAKDNEAYYNYLRQRITEIKNNK